MYMEIATILLYDQEISLGWTRRFIVNRVSSKQSNFFRFEPKQTETRSVSVVFRFVSRIKKFFSVCLGLFRCFGPVCKQLKQTEKTSKMLSIRVPSKQLLFFWFEPKKTETQSVSVVFQFIFSRNKKNFSVCFGVSDRYRNNRNKQNSWYGEFKRFIF